MRQFAFYSGLSCVALWFSHYMQCIVDAPLPRYAAGALRVMLDLMGAAWCCAQAGVSTDDIDKAVHKMIIDHGAYPSPLTYGKPLLACTQNCSTNTWQTLAHQGGVGSRACGSASHEAKSVREILRCPTWWCLCAGCAGSETGPIRRQLPKERVHLGERVHLPRHPRRAEAGGRRHRQH